MDAGRRRWLGGVALSGLLGPAIAAPTEPSEPLRVVGSEDPPFRTLDKGRASGLYFELLRAAAERAGWPVQIDIVPPARALQMLEHGSADAMMGPMRTPERERYLHYSRVTLPVEDKAFYTRAQASPITQLSDLHSLRLGVQLGKRYGPAIDDNPLLRRSEISNYRSALTMVALGRLDVAVAPEREGDRVVKDLQLPLVKQPLRLPGRTPYLVLARQSPWLARLPELEQAFESLQRDGTWASLLQRY